METEKALSLLLKLGFRRFEVFANCESEFSEEFARKLLPLTQDYGARICSVHLYTCTLEPFLFFSDYERRFRDALNHYKYYFERAARLGAGDIVFHGDRKNSSYPFEKYCRNLSALSVAAKSEGIILAQENVARCRTGTVKAVKAIKAATDGNIKFVLDVKQALRAEEDPFDMCAAMGENIQCVHLSDSSPGHDCLLPGSGSFDIKNFIGKLKSVSFNGPLITEVYRTSFSVFDELRNSLSKIELLLSQ